MTRILTSFAIIVAAVAVVAGGTYSYFMAEATETVTLDAGKGELSIVAEPFETTNWIPGDSEELRLDVVNSGDVDLEITEYDVEGAWNNNGNDEYITIGDVYYWANGDWVSGVPTSPIIAKDGGKLELKIEVKFEETGDDQSEYMGKTYSGKLMLTAQAVK